MIHMQNVIIRLVLLFTLAFPCLAHCEDIDYEIKYSPSSEIRFVPLSFETNKNKIYLAAGWGLYIVDVKCDDKEIAIVDSEVIIDEEHRYIADAKAKYYTYIVPLVGPAHFAVDVGQSFDDYKMKRIIFPEHWNTLNIKYKIRFADGTFSRNYTAQFSRVWPPNPQDENGKRGQSEIY
jgi:hypothetical protein